MPGNLILAFIRWLATHLVVITFAGFAVAGLWVFGLVDFSSLVPPLRSAPQSSATPATESVGSMPQSAEPTDPGAPFEDRAAAERRVPQDVSAGREDAPMPDRSEVLDELPHPLPERARQPKMIGGSIPLFKDQTEQPISSTGPAAGRDSGHVVSTFRPPEVIAEETPVQPSRADMLQQARRAFWNGDYEAAEAAYMALISRYPDDADGFGELGNLYRKTGRNARSLDAYYEAGRRLKAVGEGEKLQQIIDLLVEAGDDRASLLK